MKKKFVPIITIALIAGFLPACHNNNGGNAIVATAQYTITFNYCNGNASDIVRKSGETGKQIKVPEGKSFGGKIFAGWSTEYDASKQMGKLDKIVQGEKVQIGELNQVYYAAYNVVPDHTDAEVQA